MQNSGAKMTHLPCRHIQTRFSCREYSFLWPWWSPYNQGIICFLEGQSIPVIEWASYWDQNAISTGFNNPLKLPPFFSLYGLFSTVCFHIWLSPVRVLSNNASLCFINRRRVRGFPSIDCLQNCIHIALVVLWCLRCMAAPLTLLLPVLVHVLTQSPYVPIHLQCFFILKYSFTEEVWKSCTRNTHSSTCHKPSSSQRLWYVHQKRLLHQWQRGN